MLAFFKLKCRILFAIVDQVWTVNGLLVADEHICSHHALKQRTICQLKYRQNLDYGRLADYYTYYYMKWIVHGQDL